jgi:leucyl aminopeptidase
MSDILVSEAARGAQAVPVHLVRACEAAALLAGAEPSVRAYAALHAFTGKAGQALVVPSEGGGAARVLFGLGELDGPAAALALRGLASALPPGVYALAAPPAGLDPDLAVLAVALGARSFDRYKSAPRKPGPVLVVEDQARLERARRISHACALARDMIDTPANDMGPLQVETIAREVADACGAAIEVVVGGALLDCNYPAVHAVGRAAVESRAPRMIELTWTGAGEHAPHVVVVGKGVVFDTGGLDIKPSAGMRWMKKDMGGAAHALALGRMVMEAALPVRLTVLLPVVENAISGDAMRPGDVLNSRAGLTIEVGNTDAEGRLILADALTRAAELAPTLTIDLATLTGAARVALGPEVIPFYTADDDLAAETARAAVDQADPLWRMPLWAGYEASLDSDIADLKNDPDAWAQAGSVTAALFLKRFAPQSGSWMHLDIFAWTSRTRPGWPMGAEAQAIRALYAVLKARYR